MTEVPIGKIQPVHGDTIEYFVNVRNSLVRMEVKISTGWKNEQLSEAMADEVVEAAARKLSALNDSDEVRYRRKGMEYPEYVRG